MDAVAEVMTRLKALVPGLARRVEGAADFAELMRRNALPQQTPAAHVLPLGLQGGREDAIAGAFRQDVVEVVGVLLTLRTFSQTGAATLPELNLLIRDVINAVAGWGPAEAVGVFRLARGHLVTMSAGTIVYQIEFSISDQLRIPS